MYNDGKKSNENNIKTRLNALLPYKIKNIENLRASAMYPVHFHFHLSMFEFFYTSISWRGDKVMQQPSSYITIHSHNIAYVLLRILYFFSFYTIYSVMYSTAYYVLGNIRILTLLVQMIKTLTNFNLTHKFIGCSNLSWRTTEYSIFLCNKLQHRLITNFIC